MKGAGTLDGVGVRTRWLGKYLKMALTVPFFYSFQLINNDLLI